MTTRCAPNTAEFPATSEPPPADGAAPALVQVPPAGELPEPSLCGRCCVWCAAELTIAGSIDLGERDDTATGRHLFPRACPACAREHVYRQLVDHTASCEQCVDEAALCPDSAELRRALREGRLL